MMAKSFWYSWLGLVLVASPLLLCAINLSFSYYLSRRYLREMLEALQRSQHFYRWAESLPYEGWFTNFLCWPPFEDRCFGLALRFAEASFPRKT